MPNLALTTPQLSWSFASAGSSSDKESSKTLQAIQRRKERHLTLTQRARDSTLHEDPVEETESVPVREELLSAIGRLDDDLKKELSRMDMKLDVLFQRVEQVRQPTPFGVRGTRRHKSHEVLRSNTNTLLQASGSRNLNEPFRSFPDLPSALPEVTAPRTPPAPLPTSADVYSHRSCFVSVLPKSDNQDDCASSIVDYCSTCEEHAGVRVPPPSPRRLTATSVASSGINVLLGGKVLSVQVRRGRLVHAVWQFLEEPGSSRRALWFSRVAPFLVVFNVLLSLFQSQEPPILNGLGCWMFQVLFDVLCTMEALIRFLACPNRLAFFLNFSNWVDVIAAVPLFLRLGEVLCGVLWSWNYEVLHCIVPVLWLLKLLRRFEKFHLLLSAVWLAFEALPVLLFTLSIIVLSFSAVIYFVEPRDNVSGLPRAMWLTIVTMMTVGYGDVVPKSPAGGIVISALIIGSQLYMAIPLGIVGGSFSRVWEDRDRLLLVRRARLRLSQWGYTPKDILEFFYIYDQSKSGELDLVDFSKMIKDMQLGIDAERVAKLFKTFDEDNNGRVDHTEFVQALFPKYHLGDSDSVSASNSDLVRQSSRAAVAATPSMEEGGHTPVAPFPRGPEDAEQNP